MKSTLAALALGALIVVSGCNEGSPGGPGATKKNKDKDKDSSSKPSDNKVTDSGETFNLTVPTFSTKVKQGETKVVTIGIKRGKNFDENVTVKFSDVPKGVTMDPESTTIKHGDNEAKVNIKAASDAALGDFTVKVIGHPEKGPDASNDLKVTIEKK